MKHKLNSLFIGLLFTAVITDAFSQKKENGSVLITGTRFTYPLIEKWKAAFAKEYPEIPVRILTKGTAGADSANLEINAHKLAPEEIKAGYSTVNVAKYAILPVTNALNPQLKVWAKKGLREKDIKAIFFHKYDPYAEEEEEKDKGYKPNVYTRAQKAGAPITFARTYGFEQDNIIGKPIGGDDKYLITVVERDTNGITYNNLGFIYDLNTREVKPKLAVVPVDLNDNGKLDEDEKNVYNKLDDLIARLEKSKSIVPVEYINISYPSTLNNQNRNIGLFLEWVLSKGQQYNHSFGFLDFEPDRLERQKELFQASLKQ